MLSSQQNVYLCRRGQQGEDRLAILNAANRSHIEALISKLDVQPGMFVLDVGCGAGQITLQIAEKHPQSHVVGIDFDGEKIKIANQKRDAMECHRVTFREMSVDDLVSLAHEYKFDRIFIRWVLGHLTDPKQVIAACKNLLKPNGLIVCEEGNIATHHSESPHQSVNDRYGFFVENVLKLQKRRGVNPQIGANLCELFQSVFGAEAVILTTEHQLILDHSREKQAVTTAFLDETADKFVEMSVLSADALQELRSDLDQIVHDDEANIFYTKDIAVVVKKP